MCLALIAGEGCRMVRFAARFVRISRSPHCHQPVYRSEPSPRSPLMPPRAPTSLESLPSSWAPWLSRGSSPQKSRKVLWPPATTQRCALALWALPQGSMHCVLAHWQRNSRSGLSIRSQRGLTVLGPKSGMQSGWWRVAGSLLCSLHLGPSMSGTLIRSSALWRLAR